MGNEHILVWDSKPGLKQVLFTWGFILAAFQNDPIFWWTCVGISFWVVFTWYFIPRNENFISVKMTNMKPIPALSFKRTCALIATSNESALIRFVSGKLCSHENLEMKILKIHFGQNDRYEIHTVLSFISPQFMWTQVKSWLNTEVRFSTEMKSHTGLSSFRFSCERTFKIIDFHYVANKYAYRFLYNSFPLISIHIFFTFCIITSDILLNTNRSVSHCSDTERNNYSKLNFIADKQKFQIHFNELFY